VSEFISVDGVMEAPSGTEEFERVGWVDDFSRGPPRGSVQGRGDGAVGSAAPRLHIIPERLRRYRLDVMRGGTESRRERSP
jgi:hypothetical protein